MNLDITTKQTFIDPNDADTGQFPRVQAPWQVQSYGLTNICQRKTNEDQFAIAELRKTMHISQSSFAQPNDQIAHNVGHLFVVADGVGGRAGGQVASQTAVLGVEDFLLEMFCWFFDLHTGEAAEVFAEFQQALAQADTRVLEEGRRRPEFAGMSTTLTMGLLLEDCLFVGHAGDSRCYVLRENELVRVTKDHTLAAELAEYEGKEVDDAEERSTPLGNVLTNAVGGKTPGIRADVHKLRVRKGDWIVFCSDGLPKVVDKSAIRDTIVAASDPQAACESLLALVHENEGSDNTTIIAVHLV